MESLKSDRLRLTLDPARVRLRRNPARELAEGLDIDDPEFEHWLALARVQHGLASVPAQVLSPPLPATAAGTICLDLDHLFEDCAWAAHLLGDMIQTNAPELLWFNLKHPVTRMSRECAA